MRIKRLGFGIALAVVGCGAVYAQSFGLDQPVTVGTLAQAIAPYTDYLGTYTRATLPSAVTNDGKRVSVSDLGGQPGGFLRASGGCWKRVSTTTAQVQPIAVGTTVSVDGLASSPILSLTGSAFASRATVNITNACSMPQITVVAPAGVFSALGTLGISLVNGNALTVAGIGTAGTWADYAISADGSTITKIRGGSL